MYALWIYLCTHLCPISFFSTLYVGVDLQVVRHGFLAIIFSLIVCNEYRGVSHILLFVLNEWNIAENKQNWPLCISVIWCVFSCAFNKSGATSPCV